MNDAAQQIKHFNAGRDPERLALKFGKMRADPFIFLRGSCHLFYARLPREPLFTAAPLAWLCGDLHLENFGSFKGDNRLAYFDINDFDEAILAPSTLDLVRFLASVQLGARSLGVTPPEAGLLGRVFIDAYAAALGYDVAATNLQRVLERRQVITRTGTTARSGRSGGRPAALYRFTDSQYRVTDEFAALRPPG